MDEDTCPEIGLAIQNHFKAIDVRMGKRKHSKHRQSLVSLSRRHSLVQMTDNLEIDGPSPIRRISLSNSMKSTTECGTNNSAKVSLKNKLNKFVLKVKWFISNTVIKKSIFRRHGTS